MTMFSPGAKRFVRMPPVLLEGNERIRRTLMAWAYDVGCPRG
jgi:hypothetical protein